jgi:aquaporin Z
MDAQKSTKKYLAEFLGTFSLVLFGCGAAVIAGVSTEGPSGLGLLGISLAFGLAVAVMAYTIGPISGCHINPAISIAMAVAGKLPGKDLVGYVIAQCLGAIAGAAILYVLFTGSGTYSGLSEWALGSNGWGAGYMGSYNTTSAFVGEMVFTFLFLLVIFGTTAKNATPIMAGLAIGLSLALIHMVLIPITGTSVNPARSLGPALLSGGIALQQLWLFIVAPIAGALLAAFTRKWFVED